MAANGTAAVSWQYAFGHVRSMGGARCVHPAPDLLMQEDFDFVAPGLYLQLLETRYSRE